ncbi:MAG: transglycosylase SLT domain-containing protein, partial [Gammaproteobacteria bacterium]|nr:transglycosylase SLT domain-containing protein [Gammaproteobacteria bacterium]
WLFACLPLYAFAGAESQSAFEQVSVTTGIPAPVLHAIVCVESGMTPGDTKCRPWPWTLRVAGILHRYGTRKEAELALNRFLSLGITNIDVGLMQVNWRRYHHLLTSPAKALDPNNNLRVGANILSKEWRENRNRWAAF